MDRFAYLAMTTVVRPNRMNLERLAYRLDGQNASGQISLGQAGAPQKHVFRFHQAACLHQLRAPRRAGPPEDLAAGRDPLAELRHGVSAAGREGPQIRSLDRPADAGRRGLEPRIEAKARACDIFVLLVSTNSTGSDYILDKEIPIVRERQRNNDGVYFYPLLLDWTPKAGLEQVDDKNLRPRDAKPFSASAQASAAGP